MLAVPHEIELWKRHFDRIPPLGDPVARRLLAQIGMMIEAWMAKKGHHVDPKRWWWWDPAFDGAASIDESPADPDEAHRSAVLSIARGT